MFSHSYAQKILTVTMLRSAVMTTISTVPSVARRKYAARNLWALEVNISIYCLDVILLWKSCHLIGTYL